MSESVDAMVGQVRAMVRRLLGDDMMDRLEQGLPLSQLAQAKRDALVFGTGFLVRGKRMDPGLVTVVRFDPEALSLVVEHPSVGAQAYGGSYPPGRAESDEDPQLNPFR